MRTHGVSLSTALLAAVLVAGAAVAIPVAAVSVAQSRADHAKALRAERLRDRIAAPAMVVLAEYKEPSAMVYVAEDDILDGPMPLSEARSTALLYRDTGAEVFVEGTDDYTTAIADITRRHRAGEPTVRLSTVVETKGN